MRVKKNLFHSLREDGESTGAVRGPNDPGAAQVRSWPVSKDSVVCDSHSEIWGCANQQMIYLYILTNNAIPDQIKCHIHIHLCEILLKLILYVKYFFTYVCEGWG